ncbi:hypothetical protein [uncultured Serinicoccus sp.]|uniref:hypothetical protein n=1 Tax=uncultured Serinicoccus sp. TaxID=735514 RepID=UPI0026299812|nr:hypothetical protein [uncultured Serinicoccus sp.]
MGTFPGSARTVPGAIIGVEPTNPLARIVLFQYNPDEVTRTITPRAAPHGGSGASNAQRLWGSPSESISLTLDLDATDGLEVGDPIAATAGVAGRLASLEMLLHPPTATTIANTALLAAGTIEILPPDGPLTVLVLGPTRIVPVTVTSLTIREQAYSPALSPLRASVDVDLSVLTASDLSPTDAGFALSIAHQVVKESLASVAAVASAGAAASVSIGG